MSEKSKRRTVFAAASQQRGQLALATRGRCLPPLAPGWLVKFELGRMWTNDDIALEGSGAPPHARRRPADWMLEECSSHYSMEISYNRFERVSSCPATWSTPRLDLEIPQRDFVGPRNYRRGPS